MRISLNWLRKYVNIPDSLSNEELIRLIGARLVEVEGVIDETKKYDNIFIVKVVTAEKIPDTHLSLCQIDVGKEELVQVVCGAPNVRAGMMAVWIAPGATVPASVNEDAPFVIGKRKMLNKYVSNGMLAGADELDFGDDHSGIVEIDPKTAQPGVLLSDTFMLKDLVLDIENKSLTHRPDCFGIIGFAREVAGILGLDFRLTSSRDALLHPSSRGSLLTYSPLVVKALERSNLKINIEQPEICQRYSAIVMKKHGELTKKYLTLEETLLSKSGMKPISPIVDATNYYMLLTGQPLHAFDYDKFVAVGGNKKPKIVVRLARRAEKLVLLDDTEIELNDNDIVICSGDIPVALAGAMGGKSTMIDENTKNIIIESATFSLYNLRKTQMSHGIFTEAITRFTKGQPPYQTMSVAKACAETLKNGFEVAEEIDSYPKPENRIVVKITAAEVNNLLGTKYEEKALVRILENVGFDVKSKSGVMEILAPEWRTDIHIKEDIIEEIGRLSGYDNIEMTLPLHATAEKNGFYELKADIRRLLSKYGANEVLTYSFISERLLKKAGLDINNSYRIVNSISPELQYFRQSLMPSLLEKTYLNEKLPVEKFAIFEINDVYQKNNGLDKDGVPIEDSKLGLIVAERKNTETAFYKAKKYIDKLLTTYNVRADYLPLKTENAETKPFENKRSAEIRVDGEYLGVVGEFKNSVRNEFKLTPYLAGFEIDLKVLLNKVSSKKQIELVEKTTEDLTISTKKSYAEVLEEVKEKYPDALAILPVSVYQADNQESRNITFRIVRKKDK
ncbi:phenylalanine--tRNA ligase subunit beta [Candidatus Saccharibacteria bacterium]|nr:phenylalanine--tRNA ligase subunit beta [Candidatus Saccharibacteria bacterium]